MMEIKNEMTYKQYAAILIGGSLCLPVIMIGFELARLFGTTCALIAIGIGNILLFIMSLLMAKIAYESRQTTLGIAVQVFGRSGLPFFACMIVVLMLGWFAIQLDVVSTNIHLLIGKYSTMSIPLWSICIVVGMLMTCASLSGLRFVSSLAGYMVVPVIITILVSLITSWGQTKGFVVQPSAISFRSLGASISIVLAALLGLVLDLPTFMCSAKSKADAYKSLVIVFICGVPLIELVGVLFAGLDGADDSLVRQLIAGPCVWQILASLCFVSSESISNILNLYSAAMNLQTALPNRGLQVYIMIGGIIASCAAAMGVAHSIIAVLDILGIFMSSMGVGIIGWYIHSVYAFAHTRLILALSLTCGIVAGLCYVGGIFALSPSALLEAAIVSSSVLAVCTLCVELFGKKI